MRPDTANENPIDKSEHKPSEQARESLLQDVHDEKPSAAARSSETGSLPSLLITNGKVQGEAELPPKRDPKSYDTLTIQNPYLQNELLSGTVVSDAPPAAAALAESKPNSLFQNIVDWAKSFKKDIDTIIENPGVAAREIWEGMKYEAFNHPYRLAGSVALGAAGALAVGLIGTFAGAGALAAAGIAGTGLLLYQGYTAIKEIGADIRTLTDASASPWHQELARSDLRGKGGSLANIIAGTIGAGLGAGMLASWERSGTVAMLPERVEWKRDLWGSYETLKIRSWSELAAAATAVVPGAQIFPFLNAAMAYDTQRYRNYPGHAVIDWNRLLR